MSSQTPGETPLEQNVLIIGAGLAGLCCARRLAQAGIRCTIFEGADAVGGRVRTDRFDSFLLDHGFQVLLTAYPECRRILDYDALDLRAFTPGAIVHASGREHRISDPWRRPLESPGLLLAAFSIFEISDAIAMVRIRLAARHQSAEIRSSVPSVWSEPERTTLEELQRAGLSQRAIERFFRPFFGGVFFDRDLETSSRMFRFTFKMFSEGDTVLPAAGMQAIPEQVRASLPDLVDVRLGTAVRSVSAGRIALQDGTEVAGSAIVIATDCTTAQQLMPGGDLPSHGWRSTTTLYFAAERAPIDEPILILDGDGRGPINHLCIPSTIAATYAPRGASLISANIVGGEQKPREGEVRAAALDQLRGWFGSQVNQWRHLKTYQIRRALPAQPAGTLEPPQRSVRTSTPGIYIAGDHLDNSSINGAMESGRRAAEAILADDRDRRA